jgi:hypothetical protein
VSLAPEGARGAGLWGAWRRKWTGGKVAVFWSERFEELDKLVEKITDVMLEKEAG